MVTRLLWAFGLVLSLSGYLSPVQAQQSTVPACSIEAPPSGCDANMWALTVQITVPNGAYVHVTDPGCMNDAAGEIQKLLQTAVTAGMPQLALFSGPLSKLVSTPVAEAFKGQGGDIGKLFSPYAKNGALCAPLVAVVPVDAAMVGYRFFASNNGGAMGRCSAGTDCPVGWSKFQTAPIEAKGTAIRTYNAVFMNWSHNTTRQAKMIVFYKLPAGMSPLQDI